MKRKLPVVECDICTHQQVDNGDISEILGITIRSAFYAGNAGGGPVPKDTFICLHCINGTAQHGPALLDVLRILVFHDAQYDTFDLEQVYAPKEK